MIQGSDEAGPDDPEPLVKTYANRVSFQVLPAFDKRAKPHPDLADVDFGTSRHGTLGLAADGTQAFKLDGHNYGRAELVEQIDAMLAR